MYVFKIVFQVSYFNRQKSKNFVEMNTEELVIGTMVWSSVFICTCIYYMYVCICFYVYIIKLCSLHTYKNI